MKKLLAIVAVARLPGALPAEDSPYSEAALGTTNVLVIDEAAPVDVVCGHARDKPAGGSCMTISRAVLTAHTQKVSTLRERGRWM